MAKTTDPLTKHLEYIQDLQHLNTYNVWARLKLRRALIYVAELYPDVGEDPMVVAALDFDVRGFDPGKKMPPLPGEAPVNDPRS